MKRSRLRRFKVSFFAPPKDPIGYEVQHHMNTDRLGEVVNVIRGRGRRTKVLVRWNNGSREWWDIGNVAFTGRKSQRKKPAFIPEPYGLPRELTPIGEFRKGGKS